MKKEGPPISDRPRLKDIEPFALSRLAVAKHEFTHIVALWGLGKSVAFASVEPTSEYAGITIPGNSMNPAEMQIAWMASADHEGNGYDQMQAYLTQKQEGLSAQSAEATAKSMIGRYKADVLHVASIYLAFYGKAEDTLLKKFIKWAEDEVRERTEYRHENIPSWGDELSFLSKYGDIDKKDLPVHLIENITYQDDGSSLIHFKDGKTRLIHLTRPEEEKKSPPPTISPWSQSLEKVVFQPGVLPPLQNAA